MNNSRILGTETEFGILNLDDVAQDPIGLSATVVRSLTGLGRPAGCLPVTWDYSGERPLDDARGIRVQRRLADPSLLTDDPLQFATSGIGQLREISGAYTPEETAMVLPNGGRWYVDHAHPEYSSPECDDPFTVVLYDRVGDFIAQLAMKKLAENGQQVVLYKNNTDGKGAAYGAHENYQLRREVPFAEVTQALLAHFVTRPVICGAGRCGIGPTSENSGFQLSQRADFVECISALQTTFSRPIINTRDEPHDDARRWRRLHVIGGDANQFDVSNLLKLGSTSLVLSLIEAGKTRQLKELVPLDPVGATRFVSQDVRLKGKIPVQNGAAYTALEIQSQILEAVLTFESDLSASYREVVRRWGSVLDLLAFNVEDASSEVEWVGRLQILEGMRVRLGTSWDDPKILALDINWADLREQYSIISRLEKAGRITRLFTADQVQRGVWQAPGGTRATLRALATQKLAGLVRAGWDRLIIDVEGQYLAEIGLGSATDGHISEETEQALTSARESDFIRSLTGSRHEDP